MATSTLLTRIKSIPQAVKDTVHTYLKDESLFREALNTGVESFHELTSDDKERAEKVYLDVLDASPRKILEYLIHAAKAEVDDESNATPAAAPAPANLNKRARNDSAQTENKRQKADPPAGDAEADPAPTLSAEAASAAADSINVSTLALPDPKETEQIPEAAAVDSETVKMDTETADQAAPVEKAAITGSSEEGEVPTDAKETSTDKPKATEGQEEVQAEGPAAVPRAGPIPMDMEEGEIPNREVAPQSAPESEVPYGPNCAPPPPAE